ncbi:MAG: outer membrane beta-barrel protein [Bacteroidia bacterium]
MKKILFLLFSITMLQANAQKQDSLFKNTQLFVKLGVTQNNLFNNSLFEQSLVGLEMGAHLQTKWSNQFYTQVGLSYVRKGSAREIIYTNAVGEPILSYTENLYLHYVQLPVVFNYKHTFSGPSYLLVGAGAYSGYLFSAWVNPQHVYLNHEQAVGYNNWDMGGIINITYGYKKLSVYGQYQSGILNVSSDGGLNNTYLLGIAYRIK